MIVRTMSCFYLKMIIKHGFIGSTCWFRIRIYCILLNASPELSTSILFLHVLRHLVLLLSFAFFCFLLLLFWCASSHFFLFGHFSFCIGRFLFVPSSGFSKLFLSVTSFGFSKWLSSLPNHIYFFYDRLQLLEQFSFRYGLQLPGQLILSFC